MVLIDYGRLKVIKPDSEAKKLGLPSVGTVAPNFILPDIDGSKIELAKFPKPVSLVFFRHLA